MVAKKILCKGRVQGVFYRASTKSEAQKLGLKGWVRNQADGSVLIHAEGSAQKVNELVKWCEKGPTQAKVSSVEVSDSAIMELQSFEITH